MWWTRIFLTEKKEGKHETEDKMKSSMKKHTHNNILKQWCMYVCWLLRIRVQRPKGIEKY